MTPEEHSLLERTHKLVEENNKILRSMRRSSRISTALHALYWVAIIGLSLGAYYFIQPYIAATLDAYDGLRNNLQGVQGNITEVQSATDSLRDLLR